MLLSTPSAPMAIAVATIAELDRPFGVIAGIKPTSMETVLTSVVDSSAGGERPLRPCEPPPSAPGPR